MATQENDRTLELTLLGGFDARLDGQPLPGFSYNTMRALLAYLAVEPPRAHRREFLAELLWEGQELATARGNLRRTLSDLRRVIEEPSGKRLFVADKQSLRFIPDLSVDLFNFTRPLSACEIQDTQQCRDCLTNMKQTAALYRGEFLQGFGVAECQAFEEWLLLQRETLHRHALALFERIANCHEVLGNYAGALPFALRYVELEPTDESGHRRVMRLYALDNQPGVALHQYNKCVQLLKQELAVLPAEETRKLARQIQQGEIGTSKQEKKAGGELSGLVSTPSERRQATVLYCELTLKDEFDSDDPDEALEHLNEPQTHSMECIRKHGGHIVQTHGGGLLAYFGYPQASENAPRNAVLAALAIVQDAYEAVDTRIGIHTGMIITSRDPSLPDTLGKTSRLAMQLRHNLTHSGVVISQTTHTIIRDYFDCIELGKSLFRDAAQTRLYQVERASGARSRIEAAKRLTPMVGRHAELARLQALWLQAKDGRGQALLIQGEPGIGKSRLMHNFRHMAAHDGKVFELRCFAESCHTPFHPVIALLESLFRLNPTDTPEQKYHKLAAHLAACPVSRDAAAVSLLAKLLGLPLPMGQRTLEMREQEVKLRTFSTLSEVILSTMTDKPALMICEDMHWADHSTLEFMSQFVEYAKSAGIVILLSARPGFIPLWAASSANTITLQPLGKHEITQMIRALDATLPDDIVAGIIERADGLPLFIEEIVANITSGSVIAIPATLQDLLTARIDNLGRAKTTAQLAACIGREFDLQLLRAASVCSEQELENHLALLCETGLLIELEQSAAQFKHALIQDVCYQSQPRDDRRATHRRIAQALLTEFPHLVDTRQELVAQHYFAGGHAAKAAEYWVMAGRRGVAVGANMEAIEHLNAALEALRALPEDGSLTRLKTMLYLNLGAAWMSAGGYGCVEARNAHLQATALSGGENDIAGLFATLRRLWMADYMYLGSQAASEMAEQMLRLAQQSNDPVELQAAHDSYGVSLGSMGDLATSFHHYTQAAALYQPEQHAEMVSRFGENVAINNGVHFAMTLYLRGFPDQARARVEATLDIAREQAHPHSLCIALYGCSLISRWRRDVDASARYVEESIALANEFEMPFWQLSAAVDWAWVTAMRGQKTESLTLFSQLRANPEIPGAAKILFYQQLADGLIHLLLYLEALEILDDVIALADERNERYLEADYHRMKGTCLMNTSPNAHLEAETCFNRALSISRQQGALALELRAAICMANKWHEIGRVQEAIALLKDVCNRIEEGQDSYDFREAKRLVDNWL